MRHHQWAPKTPGFSSTPKIDALDILFVLLNKAQNYPVDFFFFNQGLEI